jgi:hypothetical protein
VDKKDRYAKKKIILACILRRVKIRGNEKKKEGDQYEERPQGWW